MKTFSICSLFAVCSFTCFADFVEFSGGNGGLAGTTAVIYTNNASGQTFSNVTLSGAFSGDGAGLTNLTGVAANAKTNTAADIFAASNRLSFAATVRLKNFERTLAVGGLLPALNDARFFYADFNPTNNLSYYLQPWTVVNPLYARGFMQWGTNWQSGNLPVAIQAGATHTEVFVHRKALAAAADYGPLNHWWWWNYNFIGGVQDANGGGVLLSRADRGFAVWPLTATNGGPNTNILNSYFNTTTNYFEQLTSSGFQRAQVNFDYEVLVISTSNNVTTAWVNGMPVCWSYSNLRTNSLTAVASTNVLTLFGIGTNANWTWFQTHRGGAPDPNNACSQGEETYAVLCFTNFFSQANADTLQAACFALDPSPIVTIYSGSSMLNPDNSEGGTTNAMSYYHQLDWPNECVINWASPGSQCSQMQNIPLGIGNFPTNTISDAVAAGKVVEVVTDGTRNDSFATVNAADCYALFNAVYGAFYNAGATVKFIATPLQAFGGANYDWWNTAQGFRTNQYVSGAVGGFNNAMGAISTNVVAACTVGGAHLSTVVGKMLVREEVHASRGQAYFNPTNPSEAWVFNGNIFQASDGTSLTAPGNMNQLANNNGSGLTNVTATIPVYLLTNSQPVIASTNLGLGGNGTVTIVTNNGHYSDDCFQVKVVFGTSSTVSKPIFTVNFGTPVNPNYGVYVQWSFEPTTNYTSSPLNSQYARIPFDSVTTNGFDFWNGSTMITANTTNTWLFRRIIVQ